MTTTVTRARIENWNPGIIRQKLAGILREYRPVLAEQLKTEIKTSQFSWPGVTTRRNGSRVASPRNIVDTGAFLASQRDFQPEPLKLVWAWGGPQGVTYAGIILKGKSNSYPPRDWISPALKKQPLIPFIQARW
jgi:hypothetical protein